jgi:hypothetical protein
VKQVREVIETNRAAAAAAEARAEQRHADLEKRIVRLEAGSAAASHSSSTRAPSMPDLGPQGSVGPAGQEGGPFVPRLAFIRGFSPWVKDFAQRSGGLSQDDACVVMEQLIGSLPRNLANMIERWSAGSFRNYQITLHLKECSRAAEYYDWAKSINTWCKDGGFTIQAKSIYVSLELPAWKRERNRHLRAAESAARLHLQGGEVLKIDYSNGTLWIDGSSTDQVGYWHRATSRWRWVPPVIARYGLRMEALEQSMAEELV